MSRDGAFFGLYSVSSIWEVSLMRSVLLCVCGCSVEADCLDSVSDSDEVVDSPICSGA